MPKHMHRIATFVTVLVVAAGGLALKDFQRYRQYPLAIEQVDTIQVEPGTTLTGLLRAWQDAGWLQHDRDIWWLRIHQRFQKDTRPIQAGEYALRPGLTLRAAVQQLQRGDVLQYEFTILEGWNIRQLRHALGQAEGLVAKTHELDDAALMQALDRSGQHPEGRFLPETYAYIRGFSDLDLLRRAAEAMDRTLAATWAMRAADLPLNSPEEALILASIVEKETGLAAERARIAGVFTSRLRIGMRLQTDPTVIYGIGSSFDGDLRRRDLRTDTPYNTYTRRGLPPTPIAMPGEAALLAAVQPLEQGEFYFVSRGDGSHQFSATLEQHQQAVRRYQLKR